MTCVVARMDFHDDLGVLLERGDVFVEDAALVRRYPHRFGLRGGRERKSYDRELSRQKRARRARNSARWQKARALDRQRDGNRCVSCGATKDLQVHHIVRLEDGGAEFDLANRRTLCVRCHGEQHRGIGARRRQGRSHPAPALREKHRSRDRGSRVRC